MPPDCISRNRFTATVGWAAWRPCGTAIASAGVSAGDEVTGVAAEGGGALAAEGGGAAAIGCAKSPRYFLPPQVVDIFKIPSTFFFGFRFVSFHNILVFSLPRTF